MQRVGIRQLLLLAVVFAGTLVFLAWFGEPARFLGPRVTMELPVRVGAWTGEPMLFCQAEECLASYGESDLEGARVCPRCGSELGGMALGERRLLPADTAVRHGRYRGPFGGPITVSVAVSGSGRSSIHRPEWCLPGQGFRIASSRTIEIPTRGGDPIPATLLELSAGSGVAAGSRSLPVYLYLFVGEKRNVARHVERLFWMAWENLVHGVRYRWAYVAMSMNVRSDSPDDLSTFLGFVSDLYPLLVGMEGRDVP